MERTPNADMNVEDGVCDDTDSSESERFPWKHVYASQADLKLQKSHSERPHLPDARSCLVCGTTPSDLDWIYFRSPESTWEALCGTEGWLALCERCHEQVYYFETAMN